MWPAEFEQWLAFRGGGAQLALGLACLSCEFDGSFASEWLSDVRSALTAEDAPTEESDPNVTTAPEVVLAADERAFRMGQILDAEGVAFWEALPAETMSAFLLLLPDDSSGTSPDAESAGRLASYFEASIGLEPTSPEAIELEASLLETTVIVEDVP